MAKVTRHEFRGEASDRYSRSCAHAQRVRESRAEIWRTRGTLNATTVIRSVRKTCFGEWREAALGFAFSGQPLTGAMSTVGISDCRGSGIAGSGPVPADTDNFAISPHPASVASPIAANIAHANRRVAKTTKPIDVHARKGTGVFICREQRRLKLDSAPHAEFAAADCCKSVRSTHQNTRFGSSYGRTPQDVVTLLEEGRRQ